MQRKDNAFAMLTHIIKGEPHLASNAEREPTKMQDANKYSNR